jgi:hypothetical protein
MFLKEGGNDRWDGGVDGDDVLFGKEFHGNVGRVDEVLSRSAEGMRGLCSERSLIRS